MISIATPRRRARSFMSSRICAWMVTSSAVVGSSASTIIIRCRMPPLNWCGYCASRRAGSGMPTMPSSSTARRWAAAPDIPRWISSPSVSWRPMVSTGLSEVIGSWKIMPISRPRTRRISSSPSVRRSRPLKMTWPPTMRPAGGATRRIMLSAVTDLPHPDSPTSATVSPASTSHDTPSTARTTPPRVRKCVCRLLTSRSLPTVRASLTQPFLALAPEGEDDRSGQAPLPPAAGEWALLAATGVEVGGGVFDEGGVLAADGFGDARPAMLGGPAHAFAAQAPAEIRVVQHALECISEHRRIVIRHQDAGDAIAHGRLQPAHARGDDRAATGHRLQRHHAERFVVRGQYGRVGRHIPGAQPLLWLGADEGDRVAEVEPAQPRAQLALVAVERLVGIAPDDAELGATAGRA